MKRLFSMLISCVLIFSINITAYAAHTDVGETINGIFDWQQAAIELKVGDNSCDWLMFAEGRIGTENDNCKADIEAYFSENESTLSLPDKQRLSLAAAACGADISQNGMLRSVCEDMQGDLSGRLINHLIFTLHVIDSGFYDIPSGVDLTRSALIDEILSRQTDSGALYMTNENIHETDITAMAVSALAPYANGSDEIRLSVNDMVDYLTTQITDSGTVKNWGAPSCETTVQTIIAFCAIGKDCPALIDGILTYRQPDGGFAHIDGGKTDPYATAQALYALEAYSRFQNGERMLFDIRPEHTDDISKTIEDLNNSIASLDTSDTALCDSIIQEYTNLPISERMYVYEFSLIPKELRTDCSYSPDEITQAAVLSGQSLTAANESAKPLELPSSSVQPRKGANKKAEIFVLAFVLAAAIALLIFNHTVIKKSLDKKN